MRYEKVILYHIAYYQGETLAYHQIALHAGIVKSASWNTREICFRVSIKRR